MAGGWRLPGPHGEGSGVQEARKATHARSSSRVPVFFRFLSTRRALLVDAYPHAYAGAQRTDHLLARGLGELGWELIVVTPAEGVFTERLRADGIEPRVLAVSPALSTYGRRTRGRKLLAAAVAAPRLWYRLRRLIRAEGADVVHAVGQRGLVLVGVSARLARVPLVWHVQGVSSSRSFNLVASALASAVVVPAEVMIDRMPGVARFAPVTTIPNVAEARPDPTPVNAATTDKPIVLCLARLHPDKGLDVLIEALPQVVAKHPDVSVKVLGGEQEGYEGLGHELRERATRRGVSSAIEFVGHVEEPAAHLRRASIYVQPSRERTEMLPLAILEAMAHGLPVVATDVGGVRELVRDGLTGHLIPAEDHAALATALIDLLDQPDRGRMMGAAGLKAASQPRFRPKGLCASFAAVYDTATAR